MRIPRIFSDQVLTLNAEDILDAAASHYLSTVLRMEVGRKLIIFNGQGGEYNGKIIKVSKKSTHFILNTFIPQDRQSPLTSELAICISRGERMDWVIQKATELGVSKITPLISERTEVKMSGERGQKKWHHWRQIIISACEQCQRNILPMLKPTATLSDFISREQSHLKLILHTSENTLHLDKLTSPKQVTFLVGPEGGFSDSEISSSIERDFLPWQLGPRILRTETAPITALSILQHQWGDL